MQAAECACLLHKHRDQSCVVESCGRAGLRRGSTCPRPWPAAGGNEICTVGSMAFSGCMSTYVPAPASRPVWASLVGLRTYVHGSSCDGSGAGPLCVHECRAYRACSQPSVRPATSSGLLGCVTPAAWLVDRQVPASSSGLLATGMTAHGTAPAAALVQQLLALPAGASDAYSGDGHSALQWPHDGRIDGARGASRHLLWPARLPAAAQ